MTAFSELERFVQTHRPCGELTGSGSRALLDPTRPWGYSSRTVALEAKVFHEMRMVWDVERAEQPLRES